MFRSHSETCYLVFQIILFDYFNSNPDGCYLDTCTIRFSQFVLDYYLNYSHNKIMVLVYLIMNISRHLSSALLELKEHTSCWYYIYANST